MKRVLAGLVVVASMLVSAAQAQVISPGTIQLVVPFPPGASADLLARFIGPKLSEELGGQTIVVENRGGAGGIIGASYVAKSKPDGHTLLVASSTALQSPLLQKAPAFEAVRDFVPISAVFTHPFVVASSATLEAKNFAELIAYAKANPGKLNAASLGGFSDIISLMFMNAAGVDIQVVPYRGASEAMIGVIRGDSHIVFNPYSSMEGQIGSGQLRAMAVTSLARSPGAPNVPTLAESGLPNFEIINVVGILAPAGTPDPVVKRLSDAVAKVMSSAEAKNFVVSRGNDVAPDFSSAYYGSLVNAANKKYSAVIDQIGYKKQ